MRALLLEAKSARDLRPQRTLPYPPKIESEELLCLATSLRRWRRAAAACGLVAIALAALVALSAAAPDRIPLRAYLPAAARSRPPASVPHLVAVLQQDPSSPAFLLTIDPAARTLTLRRVAAKARAGHSYELWVRAAQAKPRALGLVGDAEYTQQPLPSNFNVGAMRRARDEISFEPAGGSKSSAPTGPILFTGSLVESAPPPPPTTSSAATPARRDHIQRIVGRWPLNVAGWPPVISGGLPRPSVLMREKIPTAATTVARARPMTRIFRCLPRSALYIE